MRIVIATDGSEQAHDGARWVAGLRLTADDQVDVVAVAQRPMLLGGWGYQPASAAGVEDAAWEGVRLAFERAVDELVETLGPIAAVVRGEVLEGHPAEALARVAEERDADLVVVGPHGRGRLQSLLMGSVSQSLLQAMPTAILVTRPRASGIERVLLATDGSAPAMAATRYLARLPLPASARIEVVTVIAEHIGQTAAQEQAAAQRILADALVVLQAGGREADGEIRSGDPKERILDAASAGPADLLVVGSRGVGGFAGMILGSVSRALTKVAPCSVLVVPEHRLTRM